FFLQLFLTVPHLPAQIVSRGLGLQCFLRRASPPSATTAARPPASGSAASSCTTARRVPVVARVRDRRSESPPSMLHRPIARHTGHSFLMRSACVSTLERAGRAVYPQKCVIEVGQTGHLSGPCPVRVRRSALCRGGRVRASAANKLAPDDGSLWSFAP